MPAAGAELRLGGRIEVAKGRKKKAAPKVRKKVAASPAVEESVTQAAPAAAANGAAPDWVSSHEKLAEIFGCHSHSFPRWRKKFPHDAPKPRANCDHSVSAWREFFGRHSDIGFEVECEKKTALENRIKEEKLADLVMENARKRGEYIEVSKVETWLAEKLEQQRVLLMQCYERDLPAKLTGLRVPEMLELLIAARNRIQKPMQDLAQQIAKIKPK